MRNLNSTLLEGLLTSEPLYTEPTNDRPAAARFLLDAGADIPAMPAIAYGRLASTVRDTLHVGSAVRLVGRLGIDSSTEAMTPVVIVIEHVEVKPVRSLEAQAYAEDAAS
jgi:single-stranded DNA-binding protein